jgi:hypothetical protein
VLCKFKSGEGKANQRKGVGWWSDEIPEEIKKVDPGLGFEEYALKLLRQYQGNIKAGSGKGPTML